jgi:hypothetical protein
MELMCVIMGLLKACLLFMEDEIQLGKLVMKFGVLEDIEMDLGIGLCHRKDRVKSLGDTNISLFI